MFLLCRENENQSFRPKLGDTIFVEKSVDLFVEPFSRANGGLLFTVSQLSLAASGGEHFLNCFCALTNGTNSFSNRRFPALPRSNRGLLFEPTKVSPSSRRPFFSLVLSWISGLLHFPVPITVLRFQDRETISHPDLFLGFELYRRPCLRHAHVASCA